MNWSAIDFNNGINFSDNASFIPPFVLDPSATQNLYFGTYRLYQSTNAGTNWNAISGDLTTDAASESVTAIRVAPSDSTLCTRAHPMDNSGRPAKPSPRAGYSSRESKRSARAAS